jgi:hypothetical protein
MKLINKSIIETEEFLNAKVNELMDLADKFNILMQSPYGDKDNLTDMYSKMARIAHAVRPWDQWIIRTFPRMEKMMRELYQWRVWENKKKEIREPIRKTKMKKEDLVLSNAIKNWDNSINLYHKEKSDRHTKDD